MGTVRSRTYSDDNTQVENEATGASQPNDTSSIENLVVTEAGHRDLSRDYYRFKWFWTLIGMILLMVSKIILLVLGRLWAIVILWKSILVSVTAGLVSSVFFAGVFVLLGEYHEAMTRAVAKYVRLRPGLQ